MKKFKRTLASTLILCACLSGCSSDSEDSSIEAPPTSTEVIQTEEAPEEQYSAEQLSAMETFSNDFISFAYPNEILSVIEVEDIEMVSLSFDEDELFYPRIDFMALPIDVFRDESFYNLDEEESGLIMQFITMGMIAAYGGITLDEDGFIPDESSEDVTYFDVFGAFSEESITGTVVAEIAKSATIPSLRIESKINSVGDVGVISFLVLDIDGDSMQHDILRDSFDSMTFLG